MKNVMIIDTLLYYWMCSTVKNTELMKNCNKVKIVSKTKGFFKFKSYKTRWSVYHKGEHIQEDWTNCETKKNSKIVKKPPKILVVY